MPKRPPSMQADSMAASARPMTGKGNSSRAAPSPGSAKAAMMAASKPGPCSASISSTTTAAMAASVREAMKGTPLVPVMDTSSVPGAAAGRAAASSRAVMEADVLGLSSRMRMMGTYGSNTIWTRALG